MKRWLWLFSRQKLLSPAKGEMNSLACRGHQAAFESPGSSPGSQHCMNALEKKIATHSSILAWRIPGTEGLVGCRLWGHT